MFYDIIQALFGILLLMVLTVGGWWLLRDIFGGSDQTTDSSHVDGTYDPEADFEDYQDFVEYHRFEDLFDD